MVQPLSSFGDTDPFSFLFTTISSAQSCVLSSAVRMTDPSEFTLMLTDGGESIVFTLCCMQKAAHWLGRGWVTVMREECLGEREMRGEWWSAQTTYCLPDDLSHMMDSMDVIQHVRMSSLSFVPRLSQPRLLFSLSLDFYQFWDLDSLLDLRARLCVNFVKRFLSVPLFTSSFPS